MAVAAIPLITTAITTAVSIAGQMQQAKAQSSAANYNQKVAQRNAKIALQQGDADAEAQRRKNLITLGAMRAAYGASGVTAEGSPLDVLETSATNMELDRQSILTKARLRAMGYEEDSTLSGMSSSAARSSGLTGTVGLLIAGAGQAYSQYQDYSAAGAGSTPYYSVPGTINSYSGQVGHV